MREPASQKDEERGDVQLPDATDARRRVVIEQVRALAEKLGKPPSQRDLVEARRSMDVPSSHDVLTLFGSYGALRSAAGFPQYRKSEKPDRSPDGRHSLIEIVQALSVKLERAPKLSELREEASARGLSTAYLIPILFGSFAALLEASGIVSQGDVPSPEIIASRIKALGDRLKRTPTVRDVRRAVERDPTFPDPQLIGRVFGNFSFALERAGYSARQHHGRQWTHEEALASVATLCLELGRAPRYHEIVRSSKEDRSPSASFLKSAFGTLDAAIEQAAYLIGDEHLRSNVERETSRRRARLCSLKRRVVRVDSWPDELWRVADAFVRLGEIPSQRDYHEASIRFRLVSRSQLLERFGSYLEAVRAVVSALPSGSEERSKLERDLRSRRLRSAKIRKSQDERELLFALARASYRHAGSRPFQQRDYSRAAKQHGAPALSTILSHVGPWKGAVAKAQRVWSPAQVAEELLYRHAREHRVFLSVEHLASNGGRAVGEESQAILPSSRSLAEIVEGVNRRVVGERAPSLLAKMSPSKRVLLEPLVNSFVQQGVFPYRSQLEHATVEALIAEFGSFTQALQAAGFFVI